MNEISLLSLSFCSFEMSFCTEAVVHRGRGVFYPTRDTTQGSLVNKRDRA